MARQRRVHRPAMRLMPGPQLARHLPQLRKPPLGGMHRTFAHHLQHHAVLRRVIPARSKAGRPHPDVLAGEELGGVREQFAPGRRQRGVAGGLHLRQQAGESPSRLVHERQAERSGIGSVQDSHAVSSEDGTGGKVIDARRVVP